MQCTQHNSRGYTLIASLLLMILMSGLATALFMMVNTEQMAGGYDLNNTYVYHSAEGAMEKMSSDLAAMFTSIQSPKAADICALSNLQPTWDSTITYNVYSVAPANPPTDPSGIPCAASTLAEYINGMPPSSWNPISSGSNMGLQALLLPINMTVQAQRANGETVSMTRTAEVALIPVFQFGVFSDSDLFFGQSPNLGFAGRVHTNGDLYLGVANGYNLVFGDKLAAYGNVIREQMDNGFPVGNGWDQGTVMIPTSAGGCATQMSNLANASPSSTCLDIANTALGNTNGSVVGGHGSAQNTSTWISVSTGTYGTYLTDGNGPCGLPAGEKCPNSTGATDMTLPFVTGAASNQQVQIIREPPTGESTTSLLGSARLANLAQIRVILADNENQLHLPGWSGDTTQDFQLVSMLPSTLTTAGVINQGCQGGVNQEACGNQTAWTGIPVPASGNHYYYFGESFCTGNTYAAPSPNTVNPTTYGTVGTSYNTSEVYNSPPSTGTAAAILAGAYGNNGSGNYVGTSYQAGTYQCPSLTPNGTYNTAALAPNYYTDTNFVIPQYYGPVSNGPGGAAMTPTAFPTPPKFTTANGGTDGLEWPLIGGWLLVEVQENDGNWHGMTKEWLGLGFARGLQVPMQPGSAGTGMPGYSQPQFNSLGYYGSNFLTDHKDAILYFQQTADRDGDGTIDKYDAVPGSPAASSNTNLTNYYATASGQSNMSQYNWYPINIYDAREGENNDVTGFAQSTGTPNGIMNVVELDVGNLSNWLAGVTGNSGTLVNYTAQNGYILYFSDRRGMQFTIPNGGTQTSAQWGEYGFEDTVNYANKGSGFAPDGQLDPVNYNGVSPEDVNGNNHLDNYGVKYVGDAFGPTTTTDTDNPANGIPSPYAVGHRINTFTIGRANRVTGARHALELVDGSLGYLPHVPTSSGCTLAVGTNATGCGGFTVASENPVYIRGNYNSNCPKAANDGTCTLNNPNYDQTWTSTTAQDSPHSAAAIIADAVTVLSNNWQDAGCTGNTDPKCTNTNGSLLYNIKPNASENVPADPPDRVAITTYYRVAIAAGKNIAFDNTTQTPEFGYGMDGGVHNFLRFLEDWGGINSQAQLYYKGSLVSLYWAMYATGPFKCCNLVYAPPDRQYTFDSLFATPTNLPPGTPMFKDVDTLSYRQNQVARTN